MVSNDNRSSIADYQQCFNTFKEVDLKREDVIEEVIRHWKQSTLDLESEKVQRRRLQYEVHELHQKLQLSTTQPSVNQRSFVLVLINMDASEFIFQAKYLNNELEGGRLAASVLLATIKEYLRTQHVDLNNTDIVLRAYANLVGLAQAYITKEHMNKGINLRLFMNGFTQKQALFDFVDVGSGKGIADHKIRQNLTFHVGHGNCSHILLGCCHDLDHAPYLKELASARSIRERITFITNGTLNNETKDLGFTKFLALPSVFTSGTNTPASHQPSSTSAAHPSLEVPATVPATQPMGIKTFASRLGPVIRNSKGERIDIPLAIHGSSPNVIYLKTLNLCYKYFLSGECSGCNRNHEHPPLQLDDWYALWYIARIGLCGKTGSQTDCNDPKCVYRHQ